MPDPTTWKDVGLEFAKGFPQTVVAFGGLVWAFRRYVKPAIDQLNAKQDTALKKQDVALENQERIEKKSDGQHTKALEEIHKAGKREGALEAKTYANLTDEQIRRAVEQVLAEQSAKRGRRRSDKP